VSKFLARQHAGMSLPPTRRNIGEYFVMRTADELDVRWQSEIRNVAARDSQVTHLIIEHGNDGRRVLDEHCQLGFTLNKLLLRLLAVRDVADDIRSTDNAAFCISNGRERNRDVEGSCVFGEAYRVKVRYALAPGELREDYVLLPLPICWDQAPDRMPDISAAE
jgi:hypothetical protein